ncbi:ribosomal oxygenase 1 isoform X2 [Nasonia vitripennis]|uniref:Bifunctional lysine-specific demethylase and histidyl-hydroxylase n=1 Tax=Nasonia vitripennis TaxID=7425 RepID=A0A7M7Q9C2_NASVI|nr:ribosomal oxygenase 1 isoform X2 [Nasonia vitripennis]
MGQRINESAYTIYQNHNNVTFLHSVNCLNHRQKNNKSRKISKHVKPNKIKTLGISNGLLLAQGKRTGNFQNMKKKKNQSSKVFKTKTLTTTDLLDEEKTAYDGKKAKAFKKSSYFSTNFIEESSKLFAWLIYPLQIDEFFEKNWEKNPLHIKRNKPKYYQSLMTTPMLDQILRKNYILFTKNIDITSFTNNKRETHNPHGRALPSIVWDYYANGCSVRLLNPQTFIPKLHTLNAILQEFFGCFVGSNSYLTPPNSQGFAPHYDDIEAFILQIEGKKRWRLYKPKTDNEILPRYSSLNFSQQDLGEPILNTVIEAGDILYFPRGTIHQGDTFGFDEHSLHITLSVYQRNSWGDFLEKLIPAALNNAIKNDSRFRKGLPINYLRYIGSTYTENFDCPIRKKFSNHTISLLTILSKCIDIDKAADLMAVNHIHDFLPPVFNQNERLCSIYDGGEKMIKNGAVINRVEIEPNTLIKLSRGHCARYNLLKIFGKKQ